MNIYTFEPFGYEGSLVYIETDYRNGIPAYDIVGLADEATADMRETVKSAINNSGLYEHAWWERTLQSLSPADLRKTSRSAGLGMALGLMAKDLQSVNKAVFVSGDLQTNGDIRIPIGLKAGLMTALGSGITTAIVPKGTPKIKGMAILEASNLQEAYKYMCELKDKDFPVNQQGEENTDAITFSDWNYENGDNEEIMLSDTQLWGVLAGMAGKHHMLFTGAPGLGKTKTAMNMSLLKPELTKDEMQTHERIRSLAGLPVKNNVAPFRMPHQSATIEGICGGGPNCRPGEISLAHNGVLFLDEAGEFRTSVLQMLRVPLESHYITLSRAGRSTTFPSHFQLIMATNSCPCGNYGMNDKICLCSKRTVDEYWKKISNPLISRIGINLTFDTEKRKPYTVGKLRRMITNAIITERKRGKMNEDLEPDDIAEYCKLDKEATKFLDKLHDLPVRRITNIMKVSRTIADIKLHDVINLEDAKMAVKLTKPFYKFDD